MAFSQRLDLRQSQSLVMTPQLQQAIKLLQISNLELTSFVEQELERNPLLEPDDGDRDGSFIQDPSLVAPVVPVSDVTEPTTAVIEEGGNFANDDVALWQAEGGAEGGGDADLAGGDIETWKTRNTPLGGDDLMGLEETLRQGVTLREHLVSQLNCDIETPAERMIGLHLIDLLDESGYLTADLGEAAALLGCDVGAIEATLERLQRFDPCGVFARNLKECLGLQLRDRDRLDPCMAKLLDNLQLLANRDVNALMRVCGVDAEDLAQMVAEIKALNPKPGLGFEPAMVQAVIPDILMRPQSGGGWLIELNNDTLPRVLVNTRRSAEAWPARMPATT